MASFGSAFAARSVSTSGTLPFLAASASGVTPRSVARLTSAPLRISNSTSRGAPVGRPRDCCRAIGLTSVDVDALVDEAAGGGPILALDGVDQAEIVRCRGNGGRSREARAGDQCANMHGGTLQCAGLPAQPIFKMMIPERPDLAYLSEVRVRTVGSLLAIVAVSQFATSSPRVAAASAQSASSARSSASEVRALLDRYCVTCHNQRLKTAGLELDRLDPGLIQAERGNLGKSCSQAPHRLDAARWITSSRPGWLRDVDERARIGARRGGDARAEPRPAKRAPAEPRGICQRRPRSSRRQHRSAHLFACRRFGIRIRQHRRRSFCFTGPA